MLKFKAILLIFSALILSSCASSTPPVATPTQTQSSQPNSPTLATWTDPAGFTFQYPQNITINNHPEDDQNYANLDVGSVKILMQDDTFKDLTTWAKGSDAIETTIGDKKALKIVTDQKITLATIDNEVIVTIEAPVSEEKLLNQILESFEFFYPTPTASPSKAQTQPPPADDNILEEE